MDRTKQKAPVKEHASWPAWYYGPDGASLIFLSEDEVPEGWEDHPSKVGAGATKSSSTGADAGADIADDDTLLTQVMADNTADQLTDILEAAQEEDDSIEFLKSWPKMKLAKACIAYELIEVTESED